MSVGAARGGSESFGYGMQRRMAAKRERDKATRTKRVRDCEREMGRGFLWVCSKRRRFWWDGLRRVECERMRLETGLGFLV